MVDAKTRTIKEILDEKNAADEAMKTLMDKLGEQKQAFLADCDRIDAAIESERDSLRAEIAELSDTIKGLSGQLANGVTSSGEKIDADTKSSIRALIRETTAKKAEAEATLEAMEDVRPEYSQELYDACIAAKVAYDEALRGKYHSVVSELCETIEQLCRDAEQAKSAVRNRMSSWMANEAEKAIKRRYERRDAESEVISAAVPVMQQRIQAPMGRPAWLDEPKTEPISSNIETRVEIRDGRKVTRIIDKSTGRLIRESVE